MESAKQKKRMERNIPNAIVTMVGRENIATRKVINHLHITYIFSSCGTNYSEYSMLALNGLLTWFVLYACFSCLHWVSLLSSFVWTLNESAILHGDTMFEFSLDSKHADKNACRHCWTKTKLILINSWLSLFSYMKYTWIHQLWAVCHWNMRFETYPNHWFHGDLFNLLAPCFALRLDEVRVVKCFM